MPTADLVCLSDTALLVFTFWAISQVIQNTNCKCCHWQMTSSLITFLKLKQWNVEWLFFPSFFQYDFSISTWIVLLAREVSRKLFSQCIIEKKKTRRNIPFHEAPDIAHNCDGNLQTNSEGRTYINFPIEASNFERKLHFQLPFWLHSTKSFWKICSLLL